jgi:hypothetical protein
MHLPDRRGFPRWARILTSPWLLSPVLAFTLLIGAFEGYAAYSRTKPTHYGRGGDVFAAGLPPSPVTSGGPSVAPSVRPTPSSAAARGQGASGLPAASRRSGAGGPATSEPSPLPGGHGAVVPGTGVYRLAVNGSESVKFGPVRGCRNAFPSTATLGVAHASGESPTSYDFDLRLYPSQPSRHDERHIYRYTQTGVWLDFEEATVTCSGVKQSTTVNYSPAQLRAALPLRVGASWTSKGGDSARTEDAHAKVTGTQRLTVAGHSYLTYVIDTTVQMTGSETGSRTQRWWYAPSLGLPLRWHEELSGSRSGATYAENLTCTVTALP